VPFDFLRRRKGPAAPGEQPRAAVAGIPFDGMTEEWHLRGMMHGEGRLSDLLNRREAIPISDVHWAPVDGSAPFEPAPGLKEIDPYDLIIVLAGNTSSSGQTDQERAAHKVHKVPYDVALEAPPYRVVGTVLLYPGMEPSRLLDRATEMFLPVIDAVAHQGETQIGDGPLDAILLNRSYLRDVHQVDKRTGQRPPRLPGSPLGGVSWQDRDR
jgi:hypothetical protein